MTSVPPRRVAAAVSSESPRGYHRGTCATQSRPNLTAAGTDRTADDHGHSRRCSARCTASRCRPIAPATHPPTTYHCDLQEHHHTTPLDTPRRDAHARSAGSGFESLTAHTPPVKAHRQRPTRLCDARHHAPEGQGPFVQPSSDFVCCTITGATAPGAGQPSCWWPR